VEDKAEPKTRLKPCDFRRRVVHESDKEKLSTTDFESIYDVLHRNVGGGLLFDKKGTSSFR
jgi:hypothetical protein